MTDENDDERIFYERQKARAREIQEKWIGRFAWFAIALGFGWLIVYWISRWRGAA